VRRPDSRSPTHHYKRTIDVNEYHSPTSLVVGTKYCVVGHHHQSMVARNTLHVCMSVRRDVHEHECMDCISVIKLVNYYVLEAPHLFVNPV
jgi:hypothetical protein